MSQKILPIYSIFEEYQMTMRTDKFVERHIGPNEEEIQKMLDKKIM